MAFWNQQEEDENAQGGPVGSEPPTGGGPGGSSVVGDGGGAGSPQAAGAATAAPGANQAKPNTFAGIADYVKANKPQTQKLAGNVAGQVTDLGNQAKSSLEGAQNTFNQAVDQNTVKLDEGVFNQAKNDTTNFVKDQNNVDQFSKMRDASYAGPEDIAGQDYFNPVSQAFTKANQATENTKTESGQRSLVSDLQKQQRGRVNQGALELNTALLRGDEGARSTLEGARTANAGLNDLLGGASAASKARAAEAKATTDATKQKVNQDFLGAGGVVDQFGRSLQSAPDQVKAQAAGITQKQQDFVKQLQTNPLSAYDAILKDPQLQAYLGINDNQLKSMDQQLRTVFSGTSYDPNRQQATEQNTDFRDQNGNAAFLDLTNALYGDTLKGADQFLKQKGTLDAATINNTASADQRARDAALAQLMGTNKLIGDVDPSAEWSPDLYDFDVDSFLAQLDDVRRNRDGSKPTLAEERDIGPRGIQGLGGSYIKG